jgi:hypothetical protein
LFRKMTNDLPAVNLLAMSQEVLLALDGSLP